MYLIESADGASTRCEICSIKGERNKRCPYSSKYGGIWRQECQGYADVSMSSLSASVSATLANSPALSRAAREEFVL
jgi:hypothetical protein